MLKENMAVCNYGALLGEEKDGIRVFKGVPFALPPVGELRWRAAQKPVPWMGVRNALQFMPAPWQKPDHPEKDLKTACFSEDCLYLNIWTPAESEEESHAVFVWYYGGSYQVGRADDPTFDGTELAKRGIVVVTVNYRVNVFGFLCHPDMKANGPREHGNFGLTDQIAALEWVKENIAAFGGDPNRINIGGQSAGSASVNNLMVSPLSRDLIAGVLDQSGDVFQPERDITFDQAAESGLKLQEVLGCRSLDEMRALPASDILRPDYDAAGQNRIMCTPVIDGYVIPIAQARLLLRNEASQIPIIIGTCEAEGSGGGPGYRRRNIERFGLPEELYPDDSMPVVRALARDYWYSRHLAWIQIRVGEHKLPTWQYNFARDLPPMGAQHGTELPYMFGSMEKAGYGGRESYPEEDYRLSDIMLGYWSNFMKNGDPNGEGLPFWPQKTAEPVHLRLDLETKVEPDYYFPVHETICPKVSQWMRGRFEAEK